MFLVVEEEQLLVFSNAVRQRLAARLSVPVPMTAEIVLGEHPDGTEYNVTVRPGDPAHRARHEELGFPTDEARSPRHSPRSPKAGQCREDRHHPVRDP